MCKSLEEHTDSLRVLLAHATCRPSPDMRKHINMLQRRARSSSKLTPVRRIRLRDQLRDVIDSLAASGEDVGALPLPPPPPLARCRKKPQRLGQPDSMLLGWSLSCVTSPADVVRLDGPPVVLGYGERRAPAGFCDAAALIRNLGDGTGGRELMYAGKDSCPRPVQVRALAPADEASPSKPWLHSWKDLTEDPQRALTTAGYVQAYYGGAAAEQLQLRARARLPASLMLRVHERSLINFISLEPSHSGTHWDESPSVLVCLTGTRDVWIAPPGVDEACGLEPVASTGDLSHFLDYDPRDDDNRHVAWEHHELTEGEALFIPAHWWHVVRGARGSIGMSLDVADARVSS